MPAAGRRCAAAAEPPRRLGAAGSLPGVPDLRGPDGLGVGRLWLAGQMTPAQHMVPGLREAAIDIFQHLLLE